MSIIRIDFPNPAPVDITDWEKIIDIAEFNTLGTQDQAWWDFTSNTIKQGVRIMIGGTVYLSSTVTAITGTPSDYVRITPAGATASASYVSSLAGVTWNSVWNHYEDGSGNAYLFEESKEELASPKTPIGTFAKDAYFEQLTSSGQTILARDGGQVGIGNVVDFTSGVQQIILGLNEAGVITDAGSHGGGLFLVDSVNAVGNGGAVYFGTSAGADNAVGFAAIKGHLTNGSGNTDGNLDTYIRAVQTDTFLTLAERLTKNGNRLIGTTVDSGPRLVVSNLPGALPAINASMVALFHRNGGPGFSSYIGILSGNAANAAIFFGDDDQNDSGRINYNNPTNEMDFFTNKTRAVRITSDSHLLVNTISDLATLHVDGDMRVTGTDGAVILDANGKRQDMSVADGYGFKNTDAAGYMRFVTANRTNNDASANLVLNLDQSVTVNTTLHVDTIAEKTASASVTIDNALSVTGSIRPTKTVDATWNVTTTAFLIPRGIYNISWSSTGSVRIEIFVFGAWRVMAIASGTGGDSGSAVFSNGVDVRIRSTIVTETVYYQKY